MRASPPSGRAPAPRKSNRTGVRRARTPVSPAPAALALLALLAFGAIGPAGASPSPQALTPLDTDILVFYDDFESGSLASWATNDTNPGNGSDTWAFSNNRSYAGTGSAWSAGNGTQTLTWVTDGNSTADDPFFEDWENGTLGAWVAEDLNPTNGSDYWGFTGTRVHSGSAALWSAAIGFNDYANATNAAARLYDNEMDAVVYRDVDFSGLSALNYSSVTLDYWYLLDSEQFIDFLYAVYFDGAQWQNLNLASGPFAGWQQVSVSVPLSAQRIGFRFVSDSTGVVEGAFVDDIELHATHDEPNDALGYYDIDSDTTLSRPVALTPYATARVEYRYFLETESANDSLWVAYLVGTNWTATDPHTGSSGGWQFGNASVPTNATRVGFRFVADGVGHSLGAFIDEVRVVGRVLSVACNASVTSSTGFEASTSFVFSGGATQGLSPYSWSWNFSDGVRVNQMNATRLFNAVGTYTGILNVTDAVGQVCTAATVTVEVVHDTTSVGVAPAGATVVEGGSLSISGADRRGHPYALNWSLDPPSCGVLSNASGEWVDLAVSSAGGGTLCTVTGSLGNASASSRVNITHDLTAVSVDPVDAEVVEGSTQVLRAYDARGHNLLFLWSATCGNLSSPSGFFVTFTASVEGGSLCRVTATLQGGLAVANLTVLQDTSRIAISPAVLTLREGANQTFSAFDNRSHPLGVGWNLTPEACGGLGAPAGPTTTFFASEDAGGLNCTLEATFGTTTEALVLEVLHDTSVFQMVPPNATLTEGGSGTFAFADRFGHPFLAEWTVTPVACGILTANADGTQGFAVGDSPGIPCTLSARLGSLTLRSTVMVVHGAPASLTVNPANASVAAGQSASLSSEVRDGRSHVLLLSNVSWSSACANLSATTGASVAAALSNTSGGTTCAVTARLGGLSASATLTVLYAGPFNVTIEAATFSVANGASQELTARVTDLYGNPVPNADVRWSASCGALSRTTGPVVTFTAPSDLGGGSCTVTATVAGSAPVNPGTVSVTAGMSILLPILLVALAAGAGLGVFMWWRKRPKKPEPVVRLEGVPEAPTFEVDIR